MSSDIKKVTINAILLYIRSGMNIVLQLIAVRYLLQYLGEDGYGLYGVVGSIVAIVASLKGLLSSSVQRFINIAIGQDRKEQIRVLFNSAMQIHIALGAGLIILTIGIGVLIIPYLDIPQLFRPQAYWVLIFSGLTIGIDVLTVPYIAMLIAHERFATYAWLSIIDSLLKLGAVLFLFCFISNRVAVYSGLLLGECIVMRLVWMLASRSYFGDKVRLSPHINKRSIKEMALYAGYKGIGTVSNATLNSGINFILNIFGGLVVNTARTIAYQVMAAVNVLVWNVNSAFTPRLTTYYGEGNIVKYELMVQRMTKFTFIINITMAFSLSVYIYPILNLWLGKIPDYVPGFIVLIFLYSIFKSFRDSIDAVFSCEGKLKKFQLTIAVVTALTLVSAWIMLKMGFSCYWGIVTMVIGELITCIACYWLAYRTTCFDVGKILKNSIMPSVIILLSFAALYLFIKNYIPSSLNAVYLIISFIFTAASVGFISTLAILDKHEKTKLIRSLKYRFTKR